MSTYVWIQHGGEHTWLPNVANELRQMGIELAFVTTLLEGHNEIEKNGLHSTFISPEVHGRLEPLSTEELEELDQRYGPPCFQSIIDGDIHLELLYGNDRNEKCQVIGRAFRFWERYLESHPVDAFIVRETASFATRTAYAVAKKKRAPVLFRFDSGPSDDYFTLTDIDEEQCWQELVTELEPGLVELNSNERAQVDDMIERRIPPPTGPVRFRNGGVPLHQLPRAYLASLASERRHVFSQDPIGLAQIRMSRKFLVQRSLWRFTRRFFPYDQMVQEKFVYLPLYYVDEGMTRARYRFWAKNTFSLVEEIAASLPEGYHLYLKEHPGVPGDHSYQSLSQLRKIERVRIIDPNTHGYDLIKKSSSVVAIQGTTPWEAFLLKKPVVLVSSEVFYAKSRLVYKVKDICELNKVLSEALRAGDAIYDRNENEWYAFIYTVMKTAIEAKVISYTFPFYRPTTDRETNLKIAEGIANKGKRAYSGA